ncbi:MAG: glycosyltransferase [Pseudomonadota bacterium]
MADAKKIVLVLGAHRSGTSLCAAALEVLGVDLRIGDVYANEENPKGFFEQDAIIKFNDRLLAALGGSWDNPLFIGANALEQADTREWRQQARALFESVFDEATAVAIKDPRLCQLLPFWLQVLKELGYEAGNIYAIHMLRDPLEVALSQQTRTRANRVMYEMGAELAEGAALWLSLTLQSLDTTRHLQNYFLSYYTLLARPAEALQALSAFCGLQIDSSRAEVFCEKFVERNLHRSVADPVAAQTLRSEFPHAVDFYDRYKALDGVFGSADERVEELLVSSAISDVNDHMLHIMAPVVSRYSVGAREDRQALVRSADVIIDLKRRVAETASQAIPLRNQIFRLDDGIAELKAQRAAQHLEIDRLSADLSEVSEEKIALEDTEAAMRASLSWRITRPLRRVRTAQLQLRQSLGYKASHFRLRSIYAYHRLSVRHPRVAWVGRRVLRPFFSLLNTVFPDYKRKAYEKRDQGADDWLMAYQQYGTSGQYRPLISVIVPNYNHANYLRMRLDSIYSQTYEHIEVLLLDDASTDDSASILTEYRDRYPNKTTLLLSEHNSGGVFHQWVKGLKAATGDIVWIAESDDWCNDDFLSALVPFFENEGVQIAYGRTVFMDGDGDREIWSIDEYLHDMESDRWQGEFLETGQRLVADAFAVKNIIPNVSSALIRNPSELELLTDESWKAMGTCGDWVFYLHALRGGLLAYSPHVCNYYRQHGRNTSVQSHTGDPFYSEHERVAIEVRRLYRVDDSVFERLKTNLIAHWREHRDDFSWPAFTACFNMDRIKTDSSQSAPNLLMASYGFCSGGGETFPIQLANVMKSAGYNVTYLDCAQEPRNEGVRRNLREDIPVVSDFIQLEKIVEDFAIEIIHSHHAWVEGTILDLLPKSHPCATVATLHGMYETIHKYDLANILTRLVERSALLIYVADKNLDALREYQLEDQIDLVRIDNALADRPYEPVFRESLGVAEDAFVLTLVSRAMVEKGWQEGIEIVSRARDICGFDIQLLLVGDGTEYDRLAETELPAFIHLLGFQANVRGYFAVADAGFLPSKFRGESFPLVLIECLQSGRPFLASKLGEMGRMLDSPDGSAGVLIELDGDALDIEHWAQVLANLATDPRARAELQDRVAAAAQKFDSNIMARKHDEAYRIALGNRG